MAGFHRAIFLTSYFLSSVVGAQKYDLANPSSAERFFANSNINVVYDEDTNEITWTAQTPLAVGCGTSILVWKDDIEYHWQHIFSDMMDASVPTIDHAISFDINDVPIVDIDTAQTFQETSKIAFRMFAFLPYGKGILASRTYALDLNNSTLYAIDFNDGYSGNLSKYQSPSFMFDDFMGDPLAFGSGPCYESIDLTAGDSSVIVIGGGSENEGACVCEVDEGGFKRLRTLERRVQDDVVCNEYSDPLVNYTLSESAVGFSLDFANDDMVASSFYYGLDPATESDYSYDAFYDTDGISEDDVTIKLHHGIVRADQVSTDPSALAPLDVLTIDVNNIDDGSLVVGAVWLDSYFGVHYSREIFIPKSEIVQYLSSKDLDKQPAISSSEAIRESTLCPAGSIRNIASSSQGAFVMDVSSSYSEGYIASNAIDENQTTEWSTFGDGNDAYITIQLPFPANIVYVDFHTRTMTSSAQISEYQVEAGNRFGLLDVVAPSCTVPDATKSYECDLELSDEADSLSGGARNVTLVTFRVVKSSGGNTGAVDLSVYGCNMSDEILVAEEPSEETAEESDSTDQNADKTVASEGDNESSKAVDTSKGTTKKTTNTIAAIAFYVFYSMLL